MVPSCNASPKTLVISRFRGTLDNERRQTIKKRAVVDIVGPEANRQNIYAHRQAIALSPWLEASTGREAQCKEMRLCQTRCASPKRMIRSKGLGPRLAAAPQRRAVKSLLIPLLINQSRVY